MLFKFSFLFKKIQFLFKFLGFQSFTCRFRSNFGRFDFSLNLNLAEIDPE